MELRRLGIFDTQVLAALERVPRENFVLSNFSDQAYENTALPIEQGQTISQPYIVAFMTQALELEKQMRVLEIGTGSGYQAAVLSRLCRRVYTIERYLSLLRRAEERLRELGFNNVVTKVGHGQLGWRIQAPFDRVIVTAATNNVPIILKEQLAVGGVLLAPVGPAGGPQKLVRVRRLQKGFSTEDLIGVRFVPLIEPGGRADGE